MHVMQHKIGAAIAEEQHHALGPADGLKMNEPTHVNTKTIPVLTMKHDPLLKKKLECIG